MITSLPSDFSLDLKSSLNSSSDDDKDDINNSNNKLIERKSFQYENQPRSFITLEICEKMPSNHAKETDEKQRKTYSPASYFNKLNYQEQVMRSDNVTIDRPRREQMENYTDLEKSNQFHNIRNRLSVAPFNPKKQLQFKQSCTEQNYNFYGDQDFNLDDSDHILITEIAEAPHAIIDMTMKQKCRGILNQINQQERYLRRQLFETDEEQGQQLAASLNSDFTLPQISPQLQEVATMQPKPQKLRKFSAYNAKRFFQLEEELKIPSSENRTFNEKKKIFQLTPQNNDLLNLIHSKVQKNEQDFKKLSRLFQDLVSSKSSRDVQNTNTPSRHNSPSLFKHNKIILPIQLDNIHTQNPESDLKINDDTNGKNLADKDNLQISLQFESSNDSVSSGDDGLYNLSFNDHYRDHQKSKPQNIQPEKRNKSTFYKTKEVKPPDYQICISTPKQKYTISFDNDEIQQKLENTFKAISQKKKDKESLQQLFIKPKSKMSGVRLQQYVKVENEPASSLVKIEEQAQHEIELPSLPHIVEEECHNWFGYHNYTLCIFGPDNKVRQGITACVSSSYFENGMVLVIVVNTLTLALYDYSDRQSLNKWNQVIDNVNFGVTTVFIVEAVLRIIATGLVLHSASYLRSGWNLIDATVVVGGLVEMAHGTLNLKSLRIIRIFRPLKTINTIKSMKSLIQALIMSIPAFANVVLFLMFVFMLFATFGLHQFNGIFYNACRLSPEPESAESWIADVSEGRVCSTSDLGSYTCPVGLHCRNPSDNLTYTYQYEDMTERYYIYYGITNFDNIWRSLLTVFQIVTSDTWYLYMCNLMDADIPFLGGLYSVLLVVIGQFFLMNLILAVIIFAFIKSQKENLTAELQQFKQKEQKEEQNKYLLKDDNKVDKSKPKSSFLSMFAKKVKIGAKSPNTAKIKRKSPGYKRGALNGRNSSRPKLLIHKPQEPSTIAKQERKDEEIKIEASPQTAINQRLIKKSISMKASNQCEKSPVDQHENKEDQVTLNVFLKQKAQKRRIANIFNNQTANSSNPGQGNKNTSFINRNSLIMPHLDPKCKESSKTVNPYYFDKPAKNFLEDQPSQNKSSANQFYPQTVNSFQNEELLIQPSVSHENPKDIAQIQEISQASNLQILPQMKDSNKSWISVGLIDEGLQENNEGPFTAKNSVFKKIENFNFSSAIAIKTKKGVLKNKHISPSSVENRTSNNRTPKNLVKKAQQIRFMNQDGLKLSLQKASSGVLSTLNSNKESIIEKNIDQEYEKYFKTILKEASEDINDQESQQQHSGMREVVGIKLSLEYMNEQKIMRQRNAEFKQKIIERNKKSKIYKIAYNIQESIFFQLIMVLFIISNTIVLSLDKYPADNDQKDVLEVLNFYFTGVFALELILKLIAVGFKMFLQGQWFNIFDTLVVIGSLFDILISQILLNNQTNDDNPKVGSVITALRAFRLLRVFKLAKTWKRFELLLETMASTLKDIASFSVLLFLFIFIFSLLGMELFAHKVKLNLETNQVDLVDGVSPEVNFDSFINAFSLVFIVLTNDGTSEIYYNLYRSVSSISSTIYIVLLTMIGQKVILNLFIAILLQNFDEGALKQKMHQFEQNQQKRGIIQEITHGIGILRLKMADCREKLSGLPLFKYCCFLFCCCKSRNELQIEGQMQKQNKEVLQLGLKKDEKARHKFNDRIKTYSHEESACFEMDNIGVDGNPLFLIPKYSKFRINIIYLLRNTYYDYFLILVIFLNTITLALDSPMIEPGSKQARVLYYLDQGTTIVFIAETLLKIVTYGFLFNGQASYLRQVWNLWDFCIVIFSVLSLSVLSNDYKAFKVLRILRLISRNDGLQIAVKSLLLGLPNILNVTIIMLLFFLIFGVISVSQFKGKFFYCSGNFLAEIEITSKWECLGAGGEWVNQIYNFDNIPNAIITLFVMSTTAGWKDVMFNSITSTDVDYVAQSERNIFWNIFYIFFLIIGFFFFLNLFIGVVVTNFNSEKDKIGGNDLLTEKQREWIDLKLLVLRCAPIKKLLPPENKFRLLFFKIQDSKPFQTFIVVCIAVNTIVLMVKWYQQPAVIQWSLEVVNNTFTAIFIIEAFIIIIGQGVSVYFNDGWNVLNFIVAFVSAISILISSISTIKLKGFVTLLRSFRILRIIRLLNKSGRSLKMIFNTFVITLQQLVNVGALLLLFIYMYAVVGMILFGGIMRNGLMNHQINFENFINAFLTLFTVTTADSWNEILTSFIVEPSPQTQCVWNFKYSEYILLNSTTAGCGSKSIAYAYFLSFYFIVCLIFLQLFIAVILQGYDQTQIQEARLFNDKMTQQFREIWAVYDPDATTFIKLHQLRGFLWQLGAPLGFDHAFKGKRYLQDKFIASLDLPTYYDFSKYQFLDVLDALSFRVMIIDHHQQAEAELKKIQEKMKAQNDNATDNQGEHNPGNILEQQQPGDVSPESAQANNNEQSKVPNEQKKDIQSLIVLNIKDKISLEINKLLYNQDNSKISAFQDVISKEMRQRRQKEHEGQSLQDHEGLTSVHHMGAEAAVRKWKRHVARMHRESQKIDISPPIKTSKKGIIVTQGVKRFRINQSTMAVSKDNNSLEFNMNQKNIQEQNNQCSLENTLNITTRNLLIAHERFLNNKNMRRDSKELTVSQSEESLRVEDTPSPDQKAVKFLSNLERINQNYKTRFQRQNSSGEMTLEQLNELSREESSLCSN